MDEDVDGGADGLGDLLRRIGAGDVELEGLPADLIHHRGQGLTGLGHVDADDLGAVAGEVAGDGRADPPGGSRDDCAASGQGAGGAGGHECLEVEAIAGVGGHREELPGHIGGLAREQEPQGRGHRGGGEVDAVEEDAVGRRPGTHLVGQGAGEAGDALSGGGLLGALVAGARCGRDRDHSTGRDQ